MAIDDIKPAGNSSQFSYPSADAPGEAKPERNFAEVKESSKVSTGGTDASLLGAAQFKKADLQDPAKLDLMVRTSASQLVDSQTAGVPMSGADKQILADYLSEDPLMRQQIESYLRKALP